MTETHKYNLDYYYNKILVIKKGSPYYDEIKERICYRYKDSNLIGYGRGKDPESEQLLEIINELING